MAQTPRTRIYRSVAAGSLLAGLGVGTAALAPAASAAPGRVAAPLVSVGHSGRVATVAGTSPAPSTSTYDAGYVTDSTAVTSSTLSATLVVPTITCTSKVTAGIDDIVGIFGNTGSAGSFEEAAPLVSESCSGPVADYSAVAITDDSQNGTPITVYPGDTLSFQVAVGPSNESASVTDESRGGASSSATGVGFTPTGTQVDVQGGGGSGGFPKYTPAAFSSVLVNGATLKAADPTAYVEVDVNGKVEARVTPITGMGTAFEVKYVKST